MHAKSMSVAEFGLDPGHRPLPRSVRLTDLKLTRSLFPARTPRTLTEKSDRSGHRATVAESYTLARNVTELHTSLLARDDIIIVNARRSKQIVPRLLALISRKLRLLGTNANDADVSALSR